MKVPSQFVNGSQGEEECLRLLRTCLLDSEGTRRREDGVTPLTPPSVVGDAAALASGSWLGTQDPSPGAHLLNQSLSVHQTPR